MEILIDDTTIRVVEADITELQVDAVVNAANTTLAMGGGVAGAIKRRGGGAIEREAMALGPIALGDAVVTGAGDLPARHVIHAATMGPDLVTDEAILRRAARQALVRARDLRLTSIALPALGTGVGGFPLDRAAEVMLQEIALHIQGGTTLREVILVVRGREAADAFTWALRQYVPPF